MTTLRHGAGYDNSRVMGHDMTILGYGATYVTILGYGAKYDN